jgi:transcriptional regulator with XRE-family HTH domain
MNHSVQKIDIDKLRFDPDNPRLPQRLKGAGDREVIEYLLIECSLIDLMNSIAEQGYFEGEPLLVVPRADGLSYIVVEGNRRLGALKLLTTQEIPPAKPKAVDEVRQLVKVPLASVPALVFERREDILGYLGYRHITGIKEWDALAKARYLQQLRTLKGLTADVHSYKQLAREIGSQGPHVAKLLTAVALIDKAHDAGILRRLNRTEDEIEFSVLTTALGYEHLHKFIGLSGSGDEPMTNLREQALGEFFSWLFDKQGGAPTVLGESRNLGKLARVVSNEHALSLLRKGSSLDDAFLHTDGPLNALRELMQKAQNQLSSAQDALGFITQLGDGDLGQAEHLFVLSRNLRASIKDMVQSDGDDD